MVTGSVGRSRLPGKLPGKGEGPSKYELLGPSFDRRTVTFRSTSLHSGPGCRHRAHRDELPRRVDLLLRVIPLSPEGVRERSSMPAGHPAARGFPQLFLRILACCGTSSTERRAPSTGEPRQVHRWLTSPVDDGVDGSGLNGPVLVERDSFVAPLLEAVPSSATAAGRWVFLGGEAGVGKTSLVRLLLDGLAALADPPVVRRGSCDGVSTPPPLGPVIEALPELESVLEETTPETRPRLFREVRARLAEQPTVLVLEDLHWADEATLELVRFLGRRLDGLPLLGVATFRDDEVGPGDRLTTLVGDLATTNGVATDAPADAQPARRGCARGDVPGRPRSGVAASSYERQPVLRHRGARRRGGRGARHRPRRRSRPGEPGVAGGPATCSPRRPCSVPVPGSTLIAEGRRPTRRGGRRVRRGGDCWWSGRARADWRSVTTSPGRPSRTASRRPCGRSSTSARWGP